MIGKHIIKLILVVGLIGQSMVAFAEDMFMVRSQQGFPEAMSTLQNSIIEHKYTLSRVQRVDIGLTKAGYKTDRYRVVFFGKLDELNSVIDKYPQMSAYLPLKIAIFAEADETMLVALNPEFFSEVATSKELKILYSRWANDLRSIMTEVSHAD